MNKILFYNVAASSGGALAILNQYYKEVVSDYTREFYFVVSVAELEEKNKTKIIKLPWVKKTWFHRLYCDWIYIPRLVKKLEIDQVISLQNIAIPRCKAKQSVYLHNAIPFSEHKFSFFSDTFLWFYQNVIGKIILFSLTRADEIIVQTEWMKRAVVETCKIDEDRIVVKKVKMNSQNKVVVDSKIRNKTLFFYPTTPFKFKNIEVLLAACEILVTENKHNFECHITITGEENKYAQKIKQNILDGNLPMKLVGRLDQNDMELMYQKSILVFPSYLETVGLPLVEAQQYNIPIVAADCCYAHDAVGEYPNATFFDYQNARNLAEAMRKYL